MRRAQQRGLGSSGSSPGLGSCGWCLRRVRAGGAAAGRALGEMRACGAKAWADFGRRDARAGRGVGRACLVVVGGRAARCLPRCPAVGMALRRAPVVEVAVVCVAVLARSSVAGQTHGARRVGLAAARVQARARAGVLRPARAPKYFSDARTAVAVAIALLPPPSPAARRRQRWQTLATALP